MTIRNFLLAGVFGLGAAGMAAAAESSFKVEGSLGGEYDSNVDVSELEQNTGKGDAAAVVDFLVEGALKPAEALSLRAGYEFNYTAHEDLTAFDLMTNRGYAEGEYDFGAFKSGVLYNYVDANLDSHDFLIYQQVSPYISKMVGDKLFLRAAYAYTDKAFAGNPTRDATAHSGGLDAFVFLDGLNSYVIAGLKVGSEDAVSPVYDYNNQILKLRWVKRFDWLDKNMKFRAGWQFENRSYDNVTPAIDEKRHDKRHSLTADLEAPLNTHLFTTVEYRFNHYVSNLPTADYNESVVAVKLGVRF